MDEQEKVDEQEKIAPDWAMFLAFLAVGGLVYFLVNSFGGKGLIWDLTEPFTRGLVLGLCLGYYSGKSRRKTGPGRPLHYTIMLIIALFVIFTTWAIGTKAGIEGIVELFATFGGGVLGIYPGRRLRTRILRKRKGQEEQDGRGA